MDPTANIVGTGAQARGPPKGAVPGRFQSQFIRGFVKIGFSEALRIQ